MPMPNHARLRKLRELAAGSDPDPNNPTAHLRAEQAATLRADAARDFNNKCLTCQ